jgi:hypothetical protein
MKKLMLLALLVTTPAAANCDLIRNPDERAFCRGQCDLIHDPDRRAYCRAQVTPYRNNQCNLIHDHDLRERCRSES